MRSAALRKAPARPRTLQVGHGGTARNLRGVRVTTGGRVETIPTPGAFTALDGSGNPTGIGSGNWAQIIVDSAGAGSGGYTDDWAQFNGSAFVGTFSVYSPGTGQTGWFREWQAEDVTWNVGTTVNPTTHLKLDNLQNCEIVIRDVTCFGPLLELRNVSGCVIRLTNIEACHGRGRLSSVQAAVAEITGCQNNLFILDDCWAPGAFIRTDRANGSRVVATNVRGMSLFHDYGVGYCGGRDSMSRNCFWEGEFIVDALVANLVGTQPRVRLYWDDFASWQTARNLVLTADASDADVWSGGGSNNSVLTAGVHWDEDRSEFTSEYNSWYPNGAVAGVFPPLVRTGNSATGGWTPFPGDP